MPKRQHPLFSVGWLGCARYSTDVSNGTLWGGFCEDAAKKGGTTTSIVL